MRQRRSHRAAALAVAVALSALAIFVPAASAEVEIGSLGSGAGQTQDPRGVAVDHSSGLLYVADYGNNRIDVFDADTGAFLRAFGWGVADGTTAALQTCTTTCFKGLEGGGAGQFKAMRGIAVDNDPASPAFHDLYVFENGNGRVQRLTSTGAFVWMVGDGVNETSGADLCTAASGNTCGAGVGGDAEGAFNLVENGGVAVGPGGTLYVADQVGDSPTRKSRVQKYSPSGAYVEQLLLEVAGGSGVSTGFAVDGGENLYLGTTGSTGAVRKYSPAGVELFAVSPSLDNNAVTLGPTGNLFVANSISGESKVLEYSPVGALLRVFYGPLERRVPGLAFHESAGGDIFAAEEIGLGQTRSAVLHIDIPPAGPVVHPNLTSTTADPIGSVKATLHARINPEGKASQYQFEYLSDEQFKANGEAFGAGTQKTSLTALGGSGDFSLHAVEVQIAGLIPATLYHFRATASNPDGSARTGPTATFTTREPLEIGDVWATAVGTDSAILHAEVNPLESTASGYFEYVTQADFEAGGFAGAIKLPNVDASAAPLDFGAGDKPKERALTAFDLSPGTTYRYRLIATDHCKPDPEVLCTFESGARVLNTFSPVVEQGGCPNAAFRVGPGAFLPDCRGYEMVSPVDKSGADVETVFNITGFPASLDQAAADGNSVTYSTYKAFGEVKSAPYTNQYLASRDPISGWASEAISPRRKGPSLMTFFSATLDRQYKAFSDDLCRGWVVQDANPILAEGGIEGFPGLYRRDNCGAQTGAYEAITRVEPPLTEPTNLAPPRFIPELQGTSANGSVAIFSVLDNLTADAPPQPGGCQPKGDGCHSRLYEAKEGGDLDLVCVLPDGSFLAGNCVAGTAGGIGERGFSLSNAISDDGSRIFWSDSVDGPGKLYARIDGTQTTQVSAGLAQFWGAAADGSVAIYSVAGKLFEFEVDSEEERLIAEGVEGVAGMSEEASRIYFASSKVLSGEEENSEGAKAQAGKHNLYLYEAGTGLRFVATLLEKEVSGSEPSPVARFPIRRVSRVTPDGEQIAFMSAGALTGYDNTDAVSRKADQEVFLYDATANAGVGQLRCVSCNPSGARPVGGELQFKLLEHLWVAAWIPVWQSQLHGSGVLSEEGNRLYFNSLEALVARDANGQEDVYQWQAVGSGSCESTASPSYSPPNGGCIDLISSGESSKGSELVDIGADGKDVFFKTSQSLVKQDPALIDIYDARVGGGFPPPPTPPAACEGEACAPPASAPEDPTPASSSFRGPGDAHAGSKPRKICPKGKRKARGAGKSPRVKCEKRKK